MIYHLALRHELFVYFFILISYYVDNNTQTQTFTLQKTITKTRYCTIYYFD